MTAAVSLALIPLAPGSAQCVAVLSLDRPEAANSFDAGVIGGLVGHLSEIGAMKAVRAVVLRGKGRHFSAGADLAWMKASAQLSHDENVSEARGLTILFEALANLPQPTIAAVHGSAFGGAVGLVACCDVAIAEESARFSLAEVKLGLMPAVILPYLMRKMTLGGLRHQALTGRVFTAGEARDLGLVERAVPTGSLEAAVKEEIDLLLQGNPEAQAKLKVLMDETRADGLRQHPRTAEGIAAIRAGAEAQAGLAAFFAKSPAPWAAKLAGGWTWETA